MMQKLLIGVVGIGVVGAGVYYFTQNQVVAPTETVIGESAAEANPANNPFSGKGTLASLFDSSQAVKCTFSAEYKDGMSEGTFWYNDNNYRLEATYLENGISYVTNMIGTPENNYIWGDSPDGSMALVVPNEDPNGEPFAPEVDQSQPTSGFDLESGVDYDCSPWAANSAQFTPPSDIEFMDMAAMFEDLIGGGGVTIPEGVELPEGVTLPTGL